MYSLRSLKLHKTATVAPFSSPLRSFLLPYSRNTALQVVSRKSFTSIPGLPTPEEEEDGPDNAKKDEPKWKPIFWKMLESTATTLASVTVLGYALSTPHDTYSIITDNC